MLPYTSSNLPESSAGPASNTSLFGLAPDGVYLAGYVTIPAGGLLPHRFTLTLVNKHRGGLFSVALSRNHFRWELPSVLPFGARTFLPGNKAAAMIRPTP